MSKINNIDPPFEKWMKSKYVLPTIPFGLLTLVIGILNFAGYRLGDFLPKLGDSVEQFSLSQIFSFLNLIFALFVVLVSVNKFKISNEKDENTDAEKDYFKYLSLKKGSLFSETNSKEDWLNFKKSVNKTVHQFTWFWVLIWVSYFLLYFLLTVDLNSRIFPTFLNNMGSLMFVFLFMTMTVSTSKMKWYSWIKFVLIIFSISFLEYLFSGNERNQIYFGVLSGLFGGLAFAAFVGSIDSKFVNFPIWIIMTLYLYAAIQPFYLMIEYHVQLKLELSLVEEIKSIIFGLVLLLKIVMYWAVTWILRTNRLLYAIFEEGSLNYQREINFQNFNTLVETTESKLN
ncbi:MAG: hypothetical protein DHS20C18_44470 [Saprospiraceae bacterium]|nr:MAG: hypothetical protein DHS20C18_44470 [Saprospiraceae bacterium]